MRLKHTDLPADDNGELKKRLAQTEQAVRDSTAMVVEKIAEILAKMPAPKPAAVTVIEPKPPTAWSFTVRHDRDGRIVKVIARPMVKPRTGVN